MISIHEFVIRARVEQQSVETWIAAGWLVPPQTEPEPMFSDVDLARAQLIRDLREDLGVNDEGVSVILHLLDQSLRAEGVQIFIGQESGYHVLDDYSLVAAPYMLDRETVGVLGVIGPTRMDYDRVIPIVHVTARMLGSALNFRR